MSEKAKASPIKWRKVNEDDLEYAIQEGPHGDEFVRLLDSSCLSRSPPEPSSMQRFWVPLRPAEQIMGMVAYQDVVLLATTEGVYVIGEHDAVMRVNQHEMSQVLSGRLYVEGIGHIPASRVRFVR